MSAAKQKLRDKMLDQFDSAALMGCSSDFDMQSINPGSRKFNGQLTSSGIYMSLSWIETLP
ncbi:hypothetical protein ACO2Q2_09700 [Dyella sp. KRB-257]|uniref:hypothetical protein n=1 Tax=Dyella sp. KRB-257 TaxID=3400915 RepID=UPI003BFDC3EF